MNNLKRKIEKLEQVVDPPDPFGFDAIVYLVHHPDGSVERIVNRIKPAPEGEADEAKRR